MQLLLIGNILIFSVFQILIMLGYLQRNQPAKSAKYFVFWGVVTALLAYEYTVWQIVPQFIITCVVLTLIGHTFFGTFLDIYHRSTVYDRGLHLFGSFSFALLLFTFTDKNAIAGGLYRFLFVVMLGISLGTLFEIAEFASDKISRKPKNQHGLADTDTDMIFNVIGALMAGVLALYVF